MQGILIVNKDEGFTSHDIVNIVRKGLNIKKVGHTGTLDPMATGVLPICVGKATKISSYIQNSRKTYLGVMKFGFETDTLDRYGNTIKSGGSIPSFNDIKNIIPSFIGEIDQIPPMYSAIKVDGKKLYELARDNIVVERKSRRIKIYNIALLEMKNQQITLRIDCSSGTYIRSIARDLGHQLGTYATLTQLQRETVGPFTLENSISTKQLLRGNQEEILSYLKPMDIGLQEIPTVQISKDNITMIKHGKNILIPEKKPGLYRVYYKNLFLGLGTIQKKKDLFELHVNKVLME